MTDTALILVDIQNDYFEGGNWPVAKMTAASANAARLLEHARKSGQVVVHVHHEIPSDSAPFFRPGSDGARIHASVTPQRDEAVILKHHPNSFRETSLLTLLQDNKIAGAALDVFEHEPSVNAKLLKLANRGKVVLLPHMGSATLEGRIDMGEKVIINIRAFVDGHRPPDRVLPNRV